MTCICDGVNQVGRESFSARRFELRWSDGDTTHLTGGEILAANDQDDSGDTRDWLAVVSLMNVGDAMPGTGQGETFGVRFMTRVE